MCSYDAKKSANPNLDLRFSPLDVFILAEREKKSQTLFWMRIFGKTVNFINNYVQNVDI